MQPATYISQVTGLPLEKWHPHVELRQGADGEIVIDRWDAALNVAQPTAEALAEALKSPEPVDLVRAALKAAIDTKAESLRLMLITPGSGQAMEYQEAYAEAVAVDAALKASASATLDPTAYPMLAASIGCDLDPQTGKATTDLAGEARAVLAAYDLYQKAGAAIRAARLKGKAAVDAAADASAAQAAFDAIPWPALAA